MNYIIFKRFFDFVFSLIIIILLLPLFLLVAILIKLDSKGPVFFIQERVGKDLILFKLFKFRTMTIDQREVGKVIGKADGVTRTGFYLRRFKIDELPQLINVLLGDMSLIGPRPSVQNQLDDMSNEEKKRYNVRPGLTGLSQVSGNIYLTWKERYHYDLLYINNISFANDYKIFFKTFMIIIKGEDKYLHHPLDLKYKDENS